MGVAFPEGTPYPTPGINNYSLGHLDHGSSVWTLPVLGLLACSGTSLSVTLCPSGRVPGLPASASILQAHLSFLASWTAGPASGLSLRPCPSTLAPGMGLSTLPQASACWPLCLLGLLHLWSVLKLSSLLTFRHPPSTLGLSPHTVTQPTSITQPMVELSKVYTDWILHLGQNDRPCCFTLGPSLADPSSWSTSVSGHSQALCSAFLVRFLAPRSILASSE